MKNLKDEIEGTVEKICEELFLHGKYTPDKSYALPEGQITIVEAIDALTALIEQEKEKVLRGFVEHLGKKYELTMWLNEDIEQYLAERKEQFLKESEGSETKDTI